MWSTWCSVLTRNRIGPFASAWARIATAFVGSCGVSMTTTPSDVVTKLGLQPRSFVVVNTFPVTDSIIDIDWSSFLLGRGQAAVDPEHLPGDERRGVGAQEDRGA